MELLNLCSVLFLKLSIFVLQVLESLHLLLDLKALVLVLLLQTFIDLVHVVNRVFFFPEIFFDLSLIFSFLLELLQFFLELFCLFDGRFFFLLTGKHFFFHLLELFYQVFLVLFVESLLFLPFFNGFQQSILFFFKHILLLVNFSFLFLKLLLHAFCLYPQLFFHIFRILLLYVVFNDLAPFTNCIVLGHLLS